MEHNSVPTLTTPGANLPLFLTVDEAANTLRCSTKTIYRRIKANVLPAIREGGRYLIDVEVIREALIARMVRHKSKSSNTLLGTHGGVRNRCLRSTTPSTE